MPGPFRLPFFALPELARRGNRISALIEERLARSAGVRILDLIRPPRAAEEVAETIQRLAGVPRRRRVVAAEERREVLSAASLDDRRDRPSAEQRVRPADMPEPYLRPCPTGMSTRRVRHEPVLYRRSDRVRGPFRCCTD